MSGYTSSNYQYYDFDYTIRIVSRGITRLPCYNTFEFLLNIGEQQEKLALVTVQELEITTGCNEWKIPVTKKIGDVEMPVELYGRDDSKLLRDVFAFNVDYFRKSGLAHFSKPTEAFINVKENLVVNDQWRVYWIYEDSEEDMPGGYKISGSSSTNVRIIVIEEDSWQVVANQEVDAGLYEITGLGPNQKLVVGRQADGQAIAYGNITPAINN